MDFIVGLPKTMRGHDAISIIVECLTKSAHFLPIQTTHYVEQLAKTYVQEIIQLHEVPKVIISNRAIHFTSKYWKAI